MGLFSKIFGSRQSAEKGGAGEVVPVPAGWAFVESLFAELYPGQTPMHAVPPSRRGTTSGSAARPSRGRIYTMPVTSGITSPWG